MTILAVIVMAKYTLTDTMHARILTEIQARRTDGEGSSAGDRPSDSDGAAPAVSPGAAPLAPGN